MFSWRALSCVIAAALLAPLAGAQTYPVKPVRVILSVPAGATPDVTARLVTPGLAGALGQPLVVDNRGGAGGLIGAEIAAKATPDGYTIFISSPGALTILPHLRKVPYDTLKDFAPVGLISVGPFVLITHPALPVQSVKDLIALARAQPGKLNCASAGNGVANHLALELFKQMAGVNITHVPYKGAPQAVTDVLAGHMDMTFNSIAPIIAHIRAGRVKVLASRARSARPARGADDRRSGVPGFEAENWFGVFRARADAEAHHRAPERGAGQGRALPGDAEAVRRAGSGRRGQQPRGIRRVRAPRHGEIRQGRADFRRQA
jgi:tripartite-type tricarboxylate transporter receptor subunit TctC